MLFFLLPALLVATTRRGCPVAAIFRAHDWTKSSLEWSRGIEAASGCMPRQEDREREGRCSLRSLTPRYNRAGYTGKIMAVNLWADSIGFYLSPSSSLRSPSRYLFLSLSSCSPTRCIFVFPSVAPCLPFPCLSFCLRQEIRNRHIIIVHNLHLASFLANIYTAFDGHKVMVNI